MGRCRLLVGQVRPFGEASFLKVQLRLEDERRRLGLDHQHFICWHGAQLIRRHQSPSCLPLGGGDLLGQPAATSVDRVGWNGGVSHALGVVACLFL